jgi:ADP-ribosylglycohydrolase
MSEKTNCYERFLGTLLCGCIGDILGSVNQGKMFDDIKNNPIFDMVSFQYNDDTEMTIILAKYLIKIKEKKEILKEKIIIEELHEQYSNAVKKSLRNYFPSTRTILENFNSSLSIGSLKSYDSISRISPLALVHFESDDRLYEFIKFSVYFTHGENKDVLDSSFIHVKIINSILTETYKTAEEIFVYAIKLASKIKNKILHSLLISINENNKKYFEDNEWNITKTIFGFEFFQSEAIECFICALVCFFYNFSNPKNAMLMAVNCGGKTNTIAKLVGELIGVKYGISWIPSKWRNFEGKEELTRISSQLYLQFPKSRPIWFVAAPNISDKIEKEIIDLT